MNRTTQNSHHRWLWRAMTGLFAVGLATLVTVHAAAACGGHYGSLAEMAVSESDVSDLAITTLRRQGPSGLQTLLEEHASLVEAIRAGDVDADDPAAARLMRAVDAVAAQQDATWSGLYWYTDLEQARQAAAESGKPILALHLLGDLTDERSCANSRFFRAALYPDETVSTMLRDQFVLYWHSVRSVPKLTVDLGDGRRIERTITGNSIHYVLDEQARVLDAIPGMMSPGTFVAALEQAQQVHQFVARAAPSDDQAWLSARAEALAAADRRADALWGNLVLNAGLTIGQQADNQAASTNANEPSPHNTAALFGERFTREDLAQALKARPIAEMDDAEFRVAMAVIAQQAMGRAIAKEAVERPVFEAGLVTIGTGRESTQQPIGDSHWAIITQASIREPQLGERARSLIRHHATVGATDDAAVDVDAMLDSFERTMALDSLVNAFSLQVELRRWLTEMNNVETLAALNQRVYADLFRTPLNDPWMGLAQFDVYTGLPGGGLRYDAPVETTAAR